MPAASFDTQLLFGILAFQNAFVSREDFLTATNVWLQDKTVPLSDILVDRGMLKDDERQLLAALVENLGELGGDLFG